MGFQDFDDIEAMLGKSVMDLTADELVSYLKAFMHAAHGLRLSISGQRERAIMLGLQRTYGRSDAGRVVKWATWKYGGRFDGQPLTYTSFSKGMRWRCDKWHLEMQEHLKKEKRKATAPQQFSSLADMTRD